MASVSMMQIWLHLAHSCSLGLLTRWPDLLHRHHSIQVVQNSFIACTLWPLIAFATPRFYKICKNMLVSSASCWAPLHPPDASTLAKRQSPDGPSSIASFVRSKHRCFDLEPGKQRNESNHKGLTCLDCFIRPDLWQEGPRPAKMQKCYRQY